MTKATSYQHILPAKIQLLSIVRFSIAAALSHKSLSEYPILNIFDELH